MPHLSYRDTELYDYVHGLKCVMSRKEVYCLVKIVAV